MISNNEFEKSVKSKMEQWEESLPVASWEEFEKSLPAAPRPKTIYRTLVRYASVAAMLAGVLFVLGIAFHAEEPRTESTPMAQGSSPATVESPTNRTAVEQPILAEASDEVTQHTSRHRSTKNPASTQESRIVESTPTAAPITTAAVEEKPQPAKATAQPREKSIQEADYQEKLAAFEAAGRAAQSTQPTLQPVAKRERGITLSLLAANSAGGAAKEQGSSLWSMTPHIQRVNFMNMNAPAQEVITYQHQMPLSFGLMAEKRLGNWGIESGIRYTLMASELHSERKSGKQMLHYLGIPLNVKWHLPSWGKVNFALSAGTEAAWNVYGVQRFSDINNEFTDKVGGDYVREEETQWAAQVSASISYGIGQHLSLYAEPGLSYHFDNGNYATQNIWKERPLGFNIELGIRTHF